MTGAGRRLVLLRHAKAEPAGSVVDELRPLALRGRRQCGQVGAAIADRGLVPEVALVSSAVRTRQTWELVRAALGEAPEPRVEVHDRLYGAGVEQVVAALGSVDPQVRTVLVVGHEPTMSATAAWLTGSVGDPAHLAQVRAGIPTATFAVLALDAWDGAGRGAGQLLDLVRPA
ncbi:SixA phosphatase family protein [Cellulomonas bogoriensis]|uniref:Phosphohistidine phosphatase n=1 Tax=Cellulomonas bogoriensis 69B4 = DSM 16987 TaxID=1386082 RepID=A0A0A0BZ30_9CELL|nr:histidine phosphatase family protein [Cellulomonas bogoriensis]KGM13653.1 phosphohistidine phosphatase [Cellulomonas bogoriensis 69B4 = DSM 16987]